MIREDEDEQSGNPEFWREELHQDKVEMRRLALKWGLLFAGLLGFMVFALWWASAALSFSASRVDQTTRPTYAVSGRIVAARTGSPVPFATVRDDPAGHPPLFETTADMRGEFTLMTLAEPHNLVVAGLGFRPGSVRVGRIWYRWFPYGSERVEVRLEPERED